MHQPAHDSGEADPRLAAAVSRYDGSAAARAEVLAALVTARVFAGITATSTAEHVEASTGLRAESSAEMAVVLLERDGARALPVFSSTAALKRWRLDARPVPMSGAEACQAALEQGAAAVVVDTLVTVTELRDLAGGWVPVAGTGLATRTGSQQLTEPQAPPAALVTALRAAVRDEPLRAARLLEGPDGLVLGVCPRSPLAPEDLAALAQRVLARAGDALPPAGLDLSVVPPKGPGLPLVRRPFLRLP